MQGYYIHHGREKLRCGYTTGSCAAAGAKAAVLMLLGAPPPSRVELLTPKGLPLALDVLEPTQGPGFAGCAIQKDSGDDPDVTNGVRVYVRAERIPQGLEIAAGEGIGTITQPGLDQPPGAPAINTVPRQMIAAAVGEACAAQGYRGGVRVTLSIPGGEELAKKTFNPRMGIVGGLSILGTTGVVEPMSTAALLGTVRAQAGMRRAAGQDTLLLTLGNYGESFLRQTLPGFEEICVPCSNYIGDALDIALELGFSGALVVGHIGKLVKLGAGIMNTHSAQADGRMEVLVTCALLAGAGVEVLRRLPGCVTVDSGLEILREAGLLEAAMAVLLDRVQFYLDARLKGGLAAGALLFSQRFGVLGQTGRAGALLEKLKGVSV